MNELAFYYFHQGTTIKAYELLGAHYSEKGTRFCVWAPNAVCVSVVGEFNNWDPTVHVMTKINNEGLYIRKQVCMVQFSQNNKTMAQQN